MLGSLRLDPRGMRIIMFQLSGSQRTPRPLFFKEYVPLNHNLKGPLYYLRVYS